MVFLSAGCAWVKSEETHPRNVAHNVETGFGLGRWNQVLWAFGWGGDKTAQRDADAVHDCSGGRTMRGRIPG